MRSNAEIIRKILFGFRIEKSVDTTPREMQRTVQRSPYFLCQTDKAFGTEKGFHIALIKLTKRLAPATPYGKSRHSVGRFICPPTFLAILRQLHDGVQGKVHGHREHRIGLLPSH